MQAVLKILSVDESATVRVLFTTDHFHPLCKKRSTDLNIFTEHKASIDHISKPINTHNTKNPQYQELKSNI